MTHWWEHVPPLCLDSIPGRGARPMWVESVLGCRPRSQEFFRAPPVFLPPQKPTFNVETVDRKSHLTYCPLLNSIIIMIIIITVTTCISTNTTTIIVTIVIITTIVMH